MSCYSLTKISSYIYHIIIQRSTISKGVGLQKTYKSKSMTLLILYLKIYFYNLPLADGRNLHPYTFLQAGMYLLRLSFQYFS